jgi:hypothetical protein
MSRITNETTVLNTDVVFDKFLRMLGFCGDTLLMLIQLFKSKHMPKSSVKNTFNIANVFSVNVI